MANETQSTQLAYTADTSAAAYYNDSAASYGVSSADGTFFNRMMHLPNPALQAMSIAELAGQLDKEQAAETKRSMRESTEIAKATLATRLYQSQQQTQIALAKEAIEICKQA
jgi:hypothetical protein